MTTVPEAYDRAELLADLTALEEQVAAIRLKLQGGDGQDAQPAGGDWVEDPNLRAMVFLHAFYLAPAHALTAVQASEAARRAGYDPRGTAGFYVGANASLKKVGAARVMTESAQRWYESLAGQYAEQLAQAYPAG